MLDKNSLINKRILVTGASSGIGKATAIYLSTLGANIVLLGRSVERLNKTLSELKEGEHVSIAFDLCEFSEYGTLIQRCTEKGRLDGMVHCAGIAKAIPVKAFSYNLIKDTFDTNFVSFMLLSKYMSQKRFSNDRASIVALSAVNVHYPQKCMSVYEASKAALEGAVRGMAEELYTGRKIRINALIVGPTVTPMSGYQAENMEAVGSLSGITPNLMGMASPEYIAHMAAFLLDESSAYTTGRNFYVDGGRLS